MQNGSREGNGYARVTLVKIDEPTSKITSPFCPLSWYNKRCSLIIDGRVWKRTIIFPNSFFTGRWIVGLARGLVHVLPTWIFPGKKVPFSRPFIDNYAGLLKWSTRADCKSAALGLRRFESFTQHRSLTFSRQTRKELLHQLSAKRAFVFYLLTISLLHDIITKSL